MPRAVSANEAKQRLGALLGWVATHHDEVIVEHHGKPKAVIMAYAEYETMQRLRVEERRREAIERLRQVKQQVAERNQDLSESEAEELADRLVRDVIDELATEGAVRFERDRQ